MLLQKQATTMREIGDEIGTPVLFLKAVWADPVLYAGSGRRAGADLDILVRPERFSAFAKRLRQLGYQGLQTDNPLVMASKAWMFGPPHHGYVIDLHRGLAEEPYFTYPVGPLFERAHRYAGAYGPVLSLSPSDQILYAALHHANHGFDFRGQHIDDAAAVAQRFSIDWEYVLTTASIGGFRLAVFWLLGELRERSVAVPTLFATRRETRRLRVIRHLVRSRRLGRPGLWRRRVRLVNLLTTSRLTALPRALLHYVDCRTGFSSARARWYKM